MNRERTQKDNFEILKFKIFNNKFIELEMNLAASKTRKIHRLILKSNPTYYKGVRGFWKTRAS